MSDLAHLGPAELLTPRAVQHAIAQGFFLYGIEPGGNRVEVTSGGVQTVESFHTYGTPAPEEARGR